MSDNQHNPLLEAVDLLTLDRTILTMQEPIPPATHPTTHKEIHPPLLTMLIEGASSQGGSKSSDPGIPIDADALELWAQVRDLTRLWCKQLVVPFDQDDLLGSIRRWYQVHTNRVRVGLVSEGIDRDVTRMVEGWVRMIETKFDPPEKREWTDACPAYVPQRNEHGDEIGKHRCGARRITVNGDERFAIQLNVTTMTAECGRCHTKWVGEREVANLRYETNLWALERADRETERMAELERLASGQAPVSEQQKA